MVSFISGLEGKQANDELALATSDFFQPFLDGLELEGSYALKDPCYSKSLKSPDDPKCMPGSPWTAYAQSVMGGDLP